MSYSKVNKKSDLYLFKDTDNEFNFSLIYSTNAIARFKCSGEKDAYTLCKILQKAGYKIENKVFDRLFKEMIGEK